MSPQDEHAYPRENGVPRLLRSVVAFVDLLGTSVHASEDNAQRTLERLDAALRRARRQSDVDEGQSWFHTSWFSDNLSICAPLPHARFPNDRTFEEGSLGFVLVALMWLQFQLALDGFVLRGGLTVGDHFVDSDVNFGPALVGAVALERTAEFPRVILDDATLTVVDDHFRDHGVLADNPFHHELMRAPDGRTFVSYLGSVLKADDDEEAHEMLELHRTALMNMLSVHQNAPVRVAQKYDWLARYHNAFCAAFYPDWTHLLLSDVPVDPGFVPYEPADSRSGYRTSTD